MKKTKILFLSFLLAILSIFLIACGNKAKKELDRINLPKEITEDINLPKTSGNYQITWSIKENEYSKIENSILKITKAPSVDYEIVLTAKIEKFTKDFKITIKKTITPTNDEEIVNGVLSRLVLKNEFKHDEKINLADKIDDVQITYSEVNTSLLKFEDNKAYLIDNNITEDKEITLKATLKKGSIEKTKDLKVKFLKKGSTPNPSQDEMAVDNAISQLNLKKEYRFDEEIALTKKIGDVDVRFSEVGTDLLNITDEIAKLKDNNITEDKEVTLKATLKKGSVEKTKEFKIKFLKKQNVGPTPAGFLTVKESISKTDGTEVNIYGVVVAKVAEFGIYLMDKDKGSITYIAQDYKANPKNPFQGYQVGDVLKISEVTKKSTDGIVSFNNIKVLDKIQKEEHIDFEEPVDELLNPDAQFKLENQYKKFNANNVKIKELKKVNDKKLGEIVREIIVEDSNGKEYRLYIANKQICKTPTILDLKVGDKINVKGARLSNHKGAFQLLISIEGNIFKIVTIDPNEAIDYEIGQVFLPSDVNDKETIELQKMGLKYNKVEISWESNNSAIDVSTGMVSASYENDIICQLEATFKFNGVEKKKKYQITVKKREKYADELLKLIELEFALGEDKDNVRTIIRLKNLIEGVAVNYTIDNPKAGEINKNNDQFTANQVLENDLKCKITATLTKGSETKTKIFEITVKKSEKSDSEIVEFTKSTLELPGTLKANKNLDLVKSLNGTQITWEETSTPNKLDLTTGYLLDKNISDDVTVTLKATIKKGSADDFKTFNVVFTKVKKFTLIFDLNGGNSTTNIANQEIEEGQKFTKPSITPKGDGQNSEQFKYWSLDKTNPSPYDFNTIPTDNITLYAIYENYVSINKAVEKPEGEPALIRGVVVGVSKAYKSYIVADKTGFIQVKLTEEAQELPKLHQEVSVYGLRKNYTGYKNEFIIYQLQQNGFDGFYQKLGEENKEIPEGTPIELLNNFEFENNIYKLVKFNYLHKKMLPKSNEYQIKDEKGNEFIMSLKFQNGEFFDNNDFEEVQKMFADDDKLGLYEIYGFVSEYKKEKRVYLFNKKKITLKTPLTDDQVLDSVFDQLNIPQEVKNDTEVNIGQSSGSITYTITEESDPKVLTIENGKIKLTDSDITEDKTVSIKLTLKKRTAERSKTYTIKFLKKGTNPVGQMTKIDFSKNSINGSSLVDAKLKELIERCLEGEPIVNATNAKNVYQGNGNGGQFNMQPGYLKIGTSKKTGSFMLTLSKKAKKVKVVATGFATKDRPTLDINGKSQKFNGKDGLKEMEFDLGDGSTELTFTQTMGRIVIKSIEIIY